MSIPPISLHRSLATSPNWTQPEGQVLALQHQAQAANAAAPVESGLSLKKIRFRYAVSGSNPP